MRPEFRLTINGHAMPAFAGETLLGVSRRGPTPIASDCEDGDCTACRVRLVSGAVDDAGTAVGDTVLACRTTILGDAEIMFEEVPAQTKRAGLVHALTLLHGDIHELVIALPAPLPRRPGQHVRLTFDGLPARSYSPTARLDGSSDAHELVFHIQRRADSEVSRELGLSIRPGRHVSVRGPFGHAFHRSGAGRLILIADGTGFAPIWAIAHASRLAEPEREMLLMVHAEDARDFYMLPALEWLAKRGVEIVLTSPKGHGGNVLPGGPAYYLSGFEPSDTVHVAGDPDLVDTIKERACEDGACCYSEKFVASRWAPTLRDRIDAMINLASRMRQMEERAARVTRRLPEQDGAGRPAAPGLLRRFRGH